MSTVKYIFNCKTCEERLTELEKYYWLKACRFSGLYERSLEVLDRKPIDDLEKMGYIISTENNSEYSIKIKPSHRIETENAIFFCSEPDKHTQHHMSNCNYD